MAEGLFQQALDGMRRQGALSWELRAATNFAQALRNQGRSANGAALRQPSHEQFTERFDAADLSLAKQLLDEAGNAGRD